MVGLLYVKHAYNESDESVCERWAQDVYFQFFCGEEYFQPRLPCDPTNLVRFRQALGETGVEELLARSCIAARAKTLSGVQRRWLKRRQAIEPIIGHVKQDHGTRRCWLKGQTGDALHAVLCAAGYNLRWLLRAIVRLGIEPMLFALMLSRLLAGFVRAKRPSHPLPGSPQFAI